MFVILVSYRARGVQTFRRNELMGTIDNFKTFFESNHLPYKIVISEQYNDKKFNRGLLLNAAFLESEKLFSFDKKYIHMNTDYRFNLSWPCPKEILEHQHGFLELHRNPYPILGSACVFDPRAFIVSNGFPNDIQGWGGEDGAIYDRVIHYKVPLITPPHLCNSGFIQEIKDQFDNDLSDNIINMHLRLRDDFHFNGVNSSQYKVDGHGEFHDGITVFHLLIN